jgi:hypothetical protein
MMFFPFHIPCVPSPLFPAAGIACPTRSVDWRTTHSTILPPSDRFAAPRATTSYRFSIPAFTLALPVCPSCPGRAAMVSVLPWWLGKAGDSHRKALGRPGGHRRSCALRSCLSTTAALRPSPHPGHTESAVVHHGPERFLLLRCERLEVELFPTYRCFDRRKRILVVSTTFCPNTRVISHRFSLI